MTPCDCSHAPCVHDLDREREGRVVAERAVSHLNAELGIALAAWRSAVAALRRRPRHYYAPVDEWRAR